MLWKTTMPSTNNPLMESKTSFLGSTASTEELFNLLTALPEVMIEPSFISNRRLERLWSPIRLISCILFSAPHSLNCIYKPFCRPRQIDIFGNKATGLQSDGLGFAWVIQYPI